MIFGIANTALAFAVCPAMCINVQDQNVFRGGLRSPRADIYNFTEANEVHVCQVTFRHVMRLYFQTDFTV